jgi:hypothetical protein
MLSLMYVPSKFSRSACIKQHILLLSSDDVRVGLLLLGLQVRLQVASRWVGGMVCRMWKGGLGGGVVWWVW